MRAVLVPIRAFDGAKRRLSGALDAPARVDLVRELAAVVIRAAAPLPVSVVCDDAGVADFAREHGAGIVHVPPGLGLSASVQRAVAVLAAEGCDVVTVAHADLGLVSDLAAAGHDLDAGGGDEVTLVPDRRLDGTNVISVPVGAGFRFAYGPGSFERHRSEVLRSGLRCRLRYDWNMALDIDLPPDLDLLAACRRQGPAVTGVSTEGAGT